jgi:AhpD family alkylhydroperoxidase
MVRIPLASTEPTALGVVSTEGINPGIDAAQRNLYATVRQLDGIEPKLSELVRLRNAAAQNCKLCLGLRNRRALDDGLTEADVAAAIGGDRSLLTPAERSALLLADVFLGYPGEIPDGVVREVRAGLSDDQAVELVLELVLWTNNKVSRALGCDVPAVKYQIYEA